MTRLLLVVAFFTLFIFGIIADIEHEEHDQDHNHHHGHDYESHKNLFTGDDADENADEHEQREKLRLIANKIDTNHDDQITRDEMRTYIEQRIKEQQNREGDDFIFTLDPNKTAKITFDAYVRDNYGNLDTDQLEKMDKTHADSRETRRRFLTDKQKWMYLDKDNDQSLTYDEYRKFLRPENTEDLRQIEINGMINEYDSDKDGKISNDEYAIMSEAESGHFEFLTEELDTNNDGYGEYDEFARYYLPTSSMLIDEETDLLLKECDTDKNDYCSPDEIVNAYSSFSGSQITDFGADLETPREEL